MYISGGRCTQDDICKLANLADQHQMVVSRMTYQFTGKVLKYLTAEGHCQEGVWSILWTEERGQADLVE